MISILNLITDELVDVPYLITAVLESMSFFGQVLRNPELVGDLGPMVTSTGRLDPPFGSVRLCVLELFVALLYTGYPVVVTTMADEDMFSILLVLHPPPFHFLPSPYQPTSKLEWDIFLLYYLDIIES